MAKYPEEEEATGGKREGAKEKDLREQAVARRARINLAYDELKNPLSRQLYDSPCEDIFGMCGKRTADGGIKVLMQTESVASAYVASRT
jgi:curved DNA-binding protein CbpA